MAATPSSASLTRRQQQVLAAIQRLNDRDGYPPTIREIGAAVGLASPSSVHAHVRVLERAGLVSGAAGRPRARKVLTGPKPRTTTPTATGSTPLAVVLDVATRLRATQNAGPLAPGELHWGIFTSLLSQSDARGNRVPDAYLAALCIERGATCYSADRHFARFPGLDRRLPVEPQHEGDSPRAPPR